MWLLKGILSDRIEDENLPARIAYRHGRVDMNEKACGRVQDRKENRIEISEGYAAPGTRM